MNWKKEILKLTGREGLNERLELTRNQGHEGQKTFQREVGKNRKNHFLLLPLLLVLRALVPTTSPARSGRVRLDCLLLLRVPPITKS